MTIKTPHSTQHGFSLIELAVVIAVLALLIGGTVIGASLIRSGEIRSVMTDNERYVTAIRAFETKYQHLPGDLDTATSYWGDNATLCSDAAITDGAPGTCNGDADDSFDLAATNGGTGELFQSWNQLALAGLIQGSFTGASSSGATQECLVNLGNCPVSKLRDGMWATYTTNFFAGDSSAYAIHYGNYLLFGRAQSTTIPMQPVLTPSEAYTIDVKLDDGRPALGRVIARYWNGTCAAADDGTNANDDYAASYRVSDTALRCALYFTRQF